MKNNKIPTTFSGLGGALPAVFYLVLTLSGIQTYPTVWVDEGWISEPGWVLSRGEPLGNPSHGEVFRYEDRVYWMPPLQFLILAGIDALGADPLLGGRLVSAGAGLLTLLLLLAWARPLLAESAPSRRGLAVALAGLTLAFTLDPTLWKIHRSIRFESLVNLGLVAAVAAAWNPGRRGRGLLAGVAAGLAILVHPNGVLALVAAGGVLLLRRRTFRASLRDLGAAVGTVAVLCLPFVFYLAGDRGEGFANVLGQNAPHLRGDHEPVSRAWVTEWRRYAAYFRPPYLLLPLLSWGLAIAAGLRARTPRALWWAAAAIAGGLASVPNKSEVYLTALAPFVFVIAARAGLGRRRKWAAILAGAAVANFLLADVALLRRSCAYAPVAEWISEKVPPEASVAGTFLTWFPLRDRRYLEVHRNRAGDLADRRPEYVIWGDRHLEEPLFDRLREELGPFLVRHAEEVGRLDRSCYGNLVLYRVRWDEAGPATTQAWERWEEAFRDRE